MFTDKQNEERTSKFVSGVSGRMENIIPIACSPSNSIYEPAALSSIRGPPKYYIIGVRQGVYCGLIWELILSAPEIYRRYNIKQKYRGASFTVDLSFLSE